MGATAAGVATVAAGIAGVAVDRGLRDREDHGHWVGFVAEFVLSQAPGSGSQNLVIR